MRNKSKLMVIIVKSGGIIFSLATLVFVSIVVYKALIARHKVDTYEEFFFTIDSKLSNEVDVYYNDINIIYKNNKTSEVKEYINCINKQLDYEELDNNVKNLISQLENLYNQSNNYFAFKYLDLYTKFSVSYNENQTIFTASTIKAPANIYLYEKASEGSIDLNNRLTYTGAYYNTGTGILKNTAFNRSYTTKELSSYAIIYSDNAAHNMLMNNYGRENMLNFWKAKGTRAIFTQHTNWGVINAHDGVIYMNELYDFYLRDDKYGTELMNNFFAASFKLITNKNGKYNTANKTGWSGSTIHDAAIVFEENPYILVVLTNLGNSSYNYLFSKTSQLVGELHDNYWKLKYDKCNSLLN